MFEIVKYHFETTELGEQKIRIDFKYLGDNTQKIIVKVVNPILHNYWHVVGGKIEAKPNLEYWVGTTYTNPFSVKFNMDALIEFISVDTQEVLDSHYVPTFSVDYKKRSLGENYSKKNVWVVGDSHIEFCFNRYIKDKIFHTKDYIINPIGHPNVSLNRFTKRDYIRFLSAYPIMEGDDIIFMWGEIDCRVALMRNAQLKGISLAENVETTILRYKTALENIQNKYPKCNIKVIKPLPPIPDNWVDIERSREEGSLLEGSIAYDRMKTKILFDHFLELHLPKNIEILDINESLVDDKGYANTDLLIEGDHHYKFSNIVIDTLKNKLNG